MIQETPVDISRSIMDIPDFLHQDELGLIRLKGHRISLEDVTWYYNEGHSPESLREIFPTLTLAQIHKTIAFYLENRDEVNAYVAAGEAKLEAYRATTAKGPSLEELRSRRQTRATLPKD